MSRSRALLPLWLACVAASACTDGAGPTDAGRAASFDLRPSFQVDPSLFPSDPIDGIRLVATDASTSETVGTSDLAVDPTAAEWTLSLGITLGEAESRDVLVEVELLAGEVVQWSGRLGPVTVRAGSMLPAQNVDVHRGPLDNLDVVSLDLTDAPTQIVVGGTTLLVASPTMVSGSTALPTVFWASTDATVATVTAEGPVAILTGVSAGTAEIIAVAGAASAELAVEVRDVASPVGRTWVGGDPDGPSDWHNAANWSPAGVPGPNDDVLIPVESGASLSQDAAVAGLLLDDYSVLDLGGFTPTVAGDVDLRLGAVVFGGLTEVTGPGSVLLGTFDKLRLSASRALSGAVYATGDVSVEDADLDVNGQYVGVGGLLAVVGANAHLVMTQPASQVQVTGDAIFDGGDHSGRLTEGLLALQGDLLVSSRTATGFAASGNHVLYIIGQGQQSIGFGAAGTVADLVVANPVQAIFDTTVPVSGDVSVTGFWTVTTSATIGVAGTLTLLAGSTLDVDGTVTAAECFNYGGLIQGGGTHPCPPPPAADRTWLGGDAEGSPTAWENPANWTPAGVPTENESVYIPYRANAPVLSGDATLAGILVDVSGTVDLNTFTMTVAGDVSVAGIVTGGLIDVTGGGTRLHGYLGDLRVSAQRVVSDYLYVSGNLEVHAPLTVGPYGVQVAGDLSVTTDAGALVLADESSSVLVYGSTLFDGASHDGLLTSGVLILFGDFAVQSTYSPTSFLPTGTVVYLSGDVDQTVSFSNPGPTSQAFHDLYVYKSGGVAVLGSDVFVTRNLYTSSATFTRGLRASSVLEVLGGMAVYQTTFDGVAVRLVSGVSPDVHDLVDVTFTNMPTDGVQLYLELEGAGDSVPFVLDSPVFKTPPGPNGYYLQVVNTTQQGLLLVVQVPSPTPATPNDRVITGGPVSLLWPYP